MNPIAPLRRVARRILNAFDRTLHPVRRRAALARLRAAPPRSLLFVCHGNICRSPFAGALAATQLAAAGHHGAAVESAGIIGPNRPCPPDAVAAAAALGMDLSAHRSRLLTPAMVSAADLIVVMDARQRADVCRVYGRSEHDVRLLADFDRLASESRTIADPVNQPRAVFDTTYVRIARAVGVLTAAIPKRD